MSASIIAYTLCVYIKLTHYFCFSIHPLLHQSSVIDIHFNVLYYHIDSERAVRASGSISHVRQNQPYPIRPYTIQTTMIFSLNLTYLRDRDLLRSQVSVSFSYIHPCEMSFRASIGIYFSRLPDSSIGDPMHRRSMHIRS